ncbi:MAG: hypothetical protein QOI92_499 [Chloroflexota bacterium]|jgi:hypothetical protein|nr:hypothetical protein [Chloroflexota bacterium]
MNKQNLASVLWFFAGWSGGGLLFGLMGLPAILAFVPGIALAVLIRLDVAKPMWAHSGNGRRIVPINEFAAELDRRAEQRAGVGAETRRV